MYVVADIGQLKSVETTPIEMRVLPAIVTLLVPPGVPSMVDTEMDALDDWAVTITYAYAVFISYCCVSALKTRLLPPGCVAMLAIESATAITCYNERGYGK